MVSLRVCLLGLATWLLVLLNLPLQTLSQGGESDRCECDGVHCRLRAVDVIVVLDESKSMSFTRLWVAYTLQQLEGELTRDKDIGMESDCPNRYAVFGYGRATGCVVPVQKAGEPAVFLPLHEILDAYSTDLPGDSGSCEDGHSAIGHAMRLPRRSAANACVKPLVVLMTDEDSDKGCDCNPSFKKTDVIRMFFKGKDAELAVVVNQVVLDPSGNKCLGMSSNGTCFLAKPETYHDYSLVRGAILDSAFEATRRHYSRMALKVRGSIWDIQAAISDTNWHTSNALRAEFLYRLPVCRPIPTTVLTPETTLPPPTTGPPPTTAPAEPLTAPATTAPPVMTAEATQAPPEMTQAPTDPPTDPPTEAPTDPPTEAPTEPPTVACPAPPQINNGAITTSGQADRTTYEIVCDAGYSLSDSRLNLVACFMGRLSSRFPGCNDVDECGVNGSPCEQGATCVNMPGSFMCECNDGYQRASTGPCENINECMDLSHGCSERASCVDTIGSYTCQCPDGFQLAANERTCENADECRRIPSVCHANATCSDTLGSFECQCRQGLVGDGTISCAMGCTAPNGQQLEVGGYNVVTYTVNAKEALPTSVCVVYALSEASSGGLPNGVRWIPSRNISRQLMAQSQQLGFSNTEFCLILGGGSSVDGRTVTVGALSVCGTPAEVDAAISQITSTGTEQDLARAMNIQIRSGGTCAGQTGYLTVVVTMLPLGAVASSALPSEGDAVGNLATTVGRAGGVVLLLGNLLVDNENSDGYVVGFDAEGAGYEASEDEFRVIKHETGTVWSNVEPFTSYGNMALSTGGALFDANFLGDLASEPVNYPLTERAFFEYYASILPSLQRARCTGCRCDGPGEADCTPPEIILERRVCLSVLA